ncbi:MAG: glycosyltransferase [Candidatus Marinimicrobia bacterium]|nr:glycosyltransferase [Candidatus Neomarinimicrobiota bacterium]
MMISVIIVNYNVKDYLTSCISSIQNSVLNQDMEIIVVDNASFDGSIPLIQDQFPDVIVIANEKNEGFAKGINRGVQNASGEYLLILNPDTILQENTLQVFIDYMETHQEVGICGPKILNADGTLQISCKRSFPTPWVALPKILGLNKLFPKSQWAGKYNLTYLNEDEIHRVEAISGSCMFIRRDVFDKVGYFDEDFFMFGEDLDFCFRTIENGYKIHYLPTTQIIHYKGESVKVAQFDSIRSFYDAMNLFVEKHFSKTTSMLTRFGLKLGIWLKRLLAFFSSVFYQIIPASLDTVIVLGAFSIAIPLRFGNFDPLIHSYLPVLVIYVFLWLFIASVFQLYTRYILSYHRAIFSWFFTFLGIVTFTYFFKQFAFSRAVILIATVIIGVTIPGWRLLAHILISRGYLKKIHLGQFSLFNRRALIIGAGDEGLRIARSIARRLDVGIEVVGFCDKTFNPQELYREPEKHTNIPPLLGMVDDIRTIVRNHSIKELIFTSDRLTNEEIVSIMDRSKDLHLTYRIVPKEKDLLLGKAIVEDVSDIPFVNIEYTLYRRFNLVSKRLFDIVMSILLIVGLSPLILILILRFPRWKKVQFWGINKEAISGWVISSKNRFIRKIPLLFNIFQGKLSFVGSSLIPLEERTVNMLCKPGLTGLNRTKKKNQNFDSKLVYDHYYVQNQSFIFDLEIIIRTVLKL